MSVRSPMSAPPPVDVPARVRPNLVLALLCAAEFLISLDFTVVNVALPEVQNDLRFSAAGLQWVISAYALTFGGLLILGGRLGDLAGRRRTLQIGLAGFGLASLAAGLAGTASTLVIARGAQGMFAALIAPAALALLTTTFTEPEQRRRALGLWSAVLGAGFVAGAALGGPVTEYAGWQWVFLVNPPIVLIALAAARRVLPADPPSDGARARLAELDVVGALTVTAGMVALVYGLTSAGQRGWTAPVTATALLAGVALLALFAHGQTRTANPVLPPAILRLRPVVVANGVNVLLMGAFNAMIFSLTLFLQDVHGRSPLAAGLTLAPAGVAGMAGGAVAATVAARFGPVRTLAGTAAIQGLATGVLVVLPAHGTIPFVVACTLVTNFFGVIAIVMVTVAATAFVPAERQGASSGLLSTSQQVGGALGLAMATAFITAGGPTGGAGLAGYRWGLAAAALVVLAAAGLSLALRTAEPGPPSDGVSAPSGRRGQASVPAPRHPAKSG